MTKIVKVIFTEDRRGDGTEKDPVRLVPQLWTMDGQLICEAEYNLARAYYSVLCDLRNECRG